MARWWRGETIPMVKPRPHIGAIRMTAMLQRLSCARIEGRWLGCNLGRLESGKLAVPQI